MFKTNNTNGFTITFGNGFTVSVQWNDFAYCSNRDLGRESDFLRDCKGLPPITPNECKNAEVAVFMDGKWVRLARGGDSEGDDILGWASTDEVACIISIVSDKNYNGSEIRLEQRRMSDD